MDVLPFIVEMAKALGWPIAVMILALFSQKPLARLLDGLRLHRVKYKDIEPEFQADPRRGEEGAA